MRRLAAALMALAALGVYVHGLTDRITRLEHEARVERCTRLLYEDLSQRETTPAELARCLRAADIRLAWNEAPR